jgi:hypothetical protein
MRAECNTGWKPCEVANGEGARAGKRAPIDPGSSSVGQTLGVPAGWNKLASQGDVGPLRGCENLGADSTGAGIPAVAWSW